MQLFLLFPVKLLLGLAILVAIAYLAVCIFLLLRQNRLIFFPSSKIETTPADFNLAFEDVWIPIEKSQRKVTLNRGTAKQGSSSHQLHSWWIPAKGAANRVVLYLHGNGYNVGANLAQALQFHQIDLSVLLIDYRGYGQSNGGFPTEASVYQDARAAWKYLTQERKISPEQIILFGHSLGGAIAIDLALEHSNAAGLIVQSSFISMRAMVDHLGQFWMFPIDFLLTHRFNSITKVRSLKMPVLYTHGTADTLIPVAMSEALHAATPEPKQLLLVDGAEHNNIPDIGGCFYLQRLKEFVDQLHLYGQNQARNGERAERQA
ncbi:MAG: alpha/beta hydrolase [Kovacikia sp.]